VNLLHLKNVYLDSHILDIIKPGLDYDGLQSAAEWSNKTIARKRIKPRGKLLNKKPTVQEV